MQLSAYEIALIAGGFALLGALVGTWLTFRFSIELSRINDKKAAGKCLRDAFAPEILKLKHFAGKSSTEIPTILDTAFDKHYLAVQEFAFFLRKGKATSFNKAWKEYCADANGRKTDFSQYMVAPEEAIERMYAILEFTK